MNGSEYIAEFLHRRGVRRVHCMIGGANAFMIDAIARHAHLSYVCHQHEQSAAMAVDAVWRTKREMGVAMATSGPGAVNLLSGIACCYFDSTPGFYITGQVNLKESAGYRDAQVRQRGFQDTRVVAMATPITQYAVQITEPAELIHALPHAWGVALSGRMGPVLLDVPMNVQKEPMPDHAPFLEPEPAQPLAPAAGMAATRHAVQDFFHAGQRPLVLFGAGVGLAGAEDALVHWLRTHDIPFVASWNGMTCFDHDLPNYCGGIGVYGNRGANTILQNCDRLWVLGSRLDNRQRGGDTRQFVPGGRIHVIDVDGEELKKYGESRYESTQMDLSLLPALLEGLTPPGGDPAWRTYCRQLKNRYFGQEIVVPARQAKGMSPYAVVKRLQACVAANAIVIGDTGATVCWLFQMFHRRQHCLFTAGGHSPMGYALPAAIGAALENPDRQVIAISGDGGFQLNIQELQTVRHLQLPVSLVIFNNGGYGIIKQFQDSYFEGRHEASGTGYSCPDFARIADAYGLAYQRITHLDALTPDSFAHHGGGIIDIILDPHTPIEPKLEMGRPLNDQFPYMDEAEFQAINPFVHFDRGGD
ncbi:MAG: thiamine pyrophosphate-binding protein [Magnetococcales bacterium]|nr:thiamine pyrophosphate-binding protein [Magnetococcales bacterium]